MPGLPSNSSDGRCRFGVFDFDPRTLELWKNGRPVSLRPQPLKLLAILVARQGELISREEIQRALWSDDTFVDFEQGVNHAIRELRAALGDTAESPRFIQTLPRRGYRFVAPIVAGVIETTASPPAIQTQDPAGESRASPRMPFNRWWMVAAVVVALVSTLVGARTFRSGPHAPAASAPVLAVRAFSTSGTDSTVGTGLANAFAARLGTQHALPVRDVRANGVTHVMDGEIVQHGNDISVSVRLEDVAGAATVWSQQFHVRADTLFNVEDVIAERVVSALRLRLVAAEQERLRRRYTSDGAAYAQYVRGRAELVKYAPDHTRAAVQAFDRALARDGSYALARAGLAMACADMFLRFSPPEEQEQWGERAESEARAALDLDPNLAEAHLARAAVARKREFDWNATIEASQRALVLNPNLEQAHLFIAAAYYHLGYMDEALIETDKGRALHGPDIVEPLRIEALVALFSGNFAPARARLEEVSRLSSQAIGDTYLSLAYYYSGSGDRARHLLQQLAADGSASTAARAQVALAAILVAERDAAGARGLLERVLKAPYRDHHVAYGLGATYAQFGDATRAIHWLRIAADTGFPCLPWFERDPLLEPIRRTPAYQELLTYVRARREGSLSSVNR